MSKLLFSLCLLSVTSQAIAQDFFTKTALYGVRYEMIIFGLMLAGVAVFYTKTRQVAITGLVLLCLFKYEFTEGFSILDRLFGQTLADGSQTDGSWRTYFNLILMLPGFAILADIFEHSKVPALIPRYLPSNMASGIVLLFFVFVLSSFLDNIAAAMIGGSIAAAVYKNKVHIGFVAAICACANAGGAGSVVGDTTTTIIWIFGKDPLVLAQAFIPALAAFVIVAFFASRQQHAYSPAVSLDSEYIRADKKKLFVVFLILILTIFFNYFFELPAIGIWMGIIAGLFITKINLKVAINATDSTIFLVALVFCAELVPLESVPDASILSTMVIGFVSAVFNNIPLTQLTLIKGGYDWPLLSYAVGFGGSMIWFGSSAGVAVCDMFPKARSFMNWLRYGWHIPVAFIFGFGVYLLLLGWDPLKGNPPDQMPTPVGYEQSIGNSPLK